MPRAFSELTFTPSVRAHQERMGSAKTYSKFLESGPRQGHQIGPAEEAFIHARDGFIKPPYQKQSGPMFSFGVDRSGS
ncbi:hypothetical protein [Ruegeria conchae]|uniref:hypothetical protein n=1 Tax=Ruegeria conchae TaxID=981384 RepID=UPI0021A33E23|nr:hypothetical protein [Ruegeria conchae]